MKEFILKNITEYFRLLRVQYELSVVSEKRVLSDLKANIEREFCFKDLQNKESSPKDKYNIEELGGIYTIKGNGHFLQYYKNKTNIRGKKQGSYFHLSSEKKEGLIVHLDGLFGNLKGKINQINQCSSTHEFLETLYPYQTIVRESPSEDILFHSHKTY